MGSTHTRARDVATWWEKEGFLEERGGCCKDMSQGFRERTSGGIISAGTIEKEKNVAKGKGQVYRECSAVVRAWEMRKA